MYQDDNVSAIVEQKSKHKHRRRGTFHYILQKKIIIILKYLQHTVQIKTLFFWLNIRDEESERGRNNHLLQKKNVGRIDQNMGRNDPKVSN